MASGPSKQELEMYWQSSRQYFDELAVYYKQADPEYYKTNILPFYNNPLSSAANSGGTGSSGAAKLVVIAVIFVFILALGGVGFFLLLNENSSKENDKQNDPVKKEKRIESKEKDETKTPGNDDSEKGDETSLSSDDHFMIGSKKIGDKDYDKAEYHLKQVKPGSTYYEQSKQLLESIKYLRKYDK
jgi:hypothetical protein